MKKTIFEAITEARGSRPAAVEVGQRVSVNTGEWTFDSREWDWEDSSADVDLVNQKDVPADLPLGTQLDCYVWRRYGSPARGYVQETALEGNMTATRVEGGWVAK